MKATFKTVLSVVLSYLMVISILPLSVLSTSAADNNLQGEGTQESPYQIYSAEDFAYAMTAYGSNEETYLLLGNDIDISEQYQYIDVFKAHLNGNYHTIIADSRFASTNSGSICSLTYRNQAIFTYAEKDEYTRTGGFVFKNTGLISGVFAFADVKGSAGAVMCYENSGMIWNCAVFGSVDMYDYLGARASGISVTSSGTIANCYVAASISASGSSRYGTSSSHPITFGAYENSYYDKTICNHTAADGCTTEQMKSAEFISMMNKDLHAVDSFWVLDTDYINNGYPVLTHAFNAEIKSSKTNILINGTEYVTLTSDSGGDIYYTLDGSEPDTSSALYSSPIEISESVTITAKGYKDGLTGDSVHFDYVKISGEGTEGEPYIIDSEAAFRAIPELSMNAYFELTNDIFLTKEFQTFGDFYGKLEGNNHTVSAIWSNAYQNGLFKNNYGIIQNLNLQNSNKNFKTNGTFAYLNYGVISNCSFNGLSTGCVLDSTSYNCYRDTSNKNYYGLGGFVSFNYGTISNSSYIGEFDVDEGNAIGGFVGINEGTVLNCIFDANLYVKDLRGYGGADTNLIGGFVGKSSNTGTIKNSSANTENINVKTISYAGGALYTFGSLTGIEECSNSFDKTSFDYNYLEWGSVDIFRQELNGVGYSASAHIHNYKIKSRNMPTCTETGLISFECQDCGDNIDESVIPALGHDYAEEEIVNPTYEEQGYTHKICSRCGYDDKYNYVEAYKVETGACGTNATYTMDTGKGTLAISGTGAINNYRSEYNYIKKVNRTSAPWGSYDIKSVVIEDGITSIGNYAFFRNGEIEEISLPSTLQSIGTDAFYGIAVSSIGLPQGLISISSSAFGGIKNLTEIEIPESVNRIDKTAFADCSNLERVTLPCSAVLASSSDNYNNVFYNCGKLKTLYFTKGTGSMPDYETVSPFKSILGTLIEISFAEGVEYIGQNAFNGCSKLETVNMPLTKPLIGKNAFKGTPYYQTTFDENGLLISGTVLLDGMYAKGAVVIPGGVTEISDEAFKNNKNITSVIIPESVKTVGSSVFYGCSGLTSLTVPCDLDLYKDDNSFNGVTNLTELKMTKGSGTMLDFSNKYTYTPWYLSAEKFDSLILNDGITNISKYAFGYLSSLADVSLPESVSSIGNFAFCQCKALKSIALPKNLKSIGLSAFTNCTSLEKFIIPDSIESFGNTVLYNCTSLKELSVPCSLNITANSNNFKNCTNITKITLTKGTGVMRNYYVDTATYTPWYISRANIEEIILEDGITNIGDYAFYSCKGITEIEFPDTIVTIGERAFDSCNTLTNLSIPSSVKEIKKWAFRGCTALTDLTIPETVETLGVVPFINCSGIKKLTIPSNFAAVSFSGCSNIETINITKGNGVIEGTNSSYQYSPCYVSRDAIKHINLEDGITRLGNYAFYGCTGLTEISIPHTVTSIGSNALYGCTGLISIVLPVNVSSVDSYAFRNCNNLEKIYFLNDDCSIVTTTYTIPATTTIIGYPNSTAHDYANQFSRTFVEIIKLCPDCGSPITNSVTVDPTCTEKGHTTLTCDSCSHTETTDISAKGHTLVTDDGKPATCTDTGLTVGLHCSVCGEVFKAQEIIPANGHTPVIDTAKAPTCTETGLTEGSHCSVCGMIIKPQEIIPAKGHTPVIDAAKAPTCTETGLIEGSHCSVCGTVIKAQEVISATGHTPVIDAAKTPTCTETGLTEGSHCSVCETIIKAQEVVPAKGHSVAIDDAVPATCTHTGLTSGAHCSVCGETLVEQQVVPMKDHTVVIDNAKSPTCTKTGLTEGSHCSVCDKIIKAQESIPANGHSVVIDKAVVPTCTETGLTEGSHCSVCLEILKAQEVIPANGHSVVIDKAVTATCTTTGLTEGSHCSVCHEILKAQEIIPANGHSVVIDKAVTATCTETGLTEGSHCSVCHEILKAQEVIPANGHSVVIDKAIAATCTETGLTEGSHCSVCHEILKVQEVIPANSHSVVIDKAVAPTCTETGLTEGSHCSVCHEILKAQEVISANGHSWNNGVVTTPATCHADGVKTYTCTECGETKTEVIPKLEHSWNDGVITKQPTFKEKGEITYTCTLCADTYTEDIPQLEKKGKLVVSNETVRAGDIVQVKIYLDENPGITALSMDIEFPEYFVLKNVEYTDLLQNCPSNSPLSNNPFTISWASSTSSDIDTTGLLATLTFEVGLDTPIDEYPIYVFYNANNVFDSEFVNVPLVIDEGIINVLKPTPGDVNRDGNINMKDLVLIQQFINHWDVNIVESAADVNDDGEINMKDLVILQRYINGWEVVLK